MRRPESVLELTCAQQEGMDVHAQTTALLARNVRDMDLAERVERALRATGYPALRDVEIVVRDGRVVLGGRVPSYYMKQIAQVAVLAVPGALELANDLDVAGTR
jgi:osmotically-inducible protein OsmY